MPGLICESSRSCWALSCRRHHSTPCEHQPSAGGVSRRIRGLAHGVVNDSCDDSLAVRHGGRVPGGDGQSALKHGAQARGHVKSAASIISDLAASRVLPRCFALLPNLSQTRGIRAICHVLRSNGEGLAHRPRPASPRSHARRSGSRSLVHCIRHRRCIEPDDGIIGIGSGGGVRCGRAGMISIQTSTRATLWQRPCASSQRSVSIRTRKSPSMSCRRPHHSEDGSLSRWSGEHRGGLSDLYKGEDREWTPNPQQIVRAGQIYRRQLEAKRAVAIALRKRWRRQRFGGFA